MKEKIKDMVITKKFLCEFVPLMLRTLSPTNTCRWDNLTLSENNIEIDPYTGKQGSGFIIKITVPVTQVTIGQENNITTLTNILYDLSENVGENLIFVIKTKLV